MNRADRSSSRVADLEGANLALWVARAIGWRIEYEGAKPICYDDQGSVYSFGKCGFRPDLNWSQGGPIIERERINIVDHAEHQRPFSGARDNDRPDQFAAFIGDPFQLHDLGSFSFFDTQMGRTPLVAAMRAFVASKFGDEVPDE
jgi:hypothetical protein